MSKWNRHPMMMAATHEKLIASFPMHIDLDSVNFRDGDEGLLDARELDKLQDIENDYSDDIDRFFQKREERIERYAQLAAWCEPCEISIFG